MRAFRTGLMRGAAVALGLGALALSSLPPRAQTPPSSNRVALVIGEGAYRAGPVPAAPDDAGLVAQLLAGAGFDVTGARDLDGDALRRAVRDFLDRAGAAGPDGIAIVYLAGRAVQSDGDDYFLPVDARLARPSDVPIEALRLADMTHALAALPIQARVVVVDGAYAGGPSVASPPGLGLLEAEQGELLAFNAAPGTVAPATSGPYGVYAQALVAAVKQGGVPVAEVFDRVRLAVNQATGGGVVPWDSDKLTRSFAVFERAPGAPAMASAQVPFAALEKRPLRDFPPDQAYDVAVARDTLPAYAEFLAAFPGDPLARRVRLLGAGLREASFWRAAVNGNTPGAFWTYLVRYPKGPHAADARRRLTRLAAAALPPPRFVPLGFDVPPPGPDEVLVGPVVFDAPDLPPPPPPPVFLLPPPVEVVLIRPPPPPGPAFLPVPVPVAIPSVRAPADPGLIAPPRGVAGDYPRPRPYARGPNGDGLVVQTVPPPGEARPRPSAPTPRPAAPGPAPVARPAPQPRPAALPIPPTPPSPDAPRAPVPPVAPVMRPLPTPGLPVPPTAPPPATRAPPPRDRPAPAGAAGPGPAASPPAPPPAPPGLPPPAPASAPPPRKAPPSPPTALAPPARRIAPKPEAAPSPAARPATPERSFAPPPPAPKAAPPVPPPPHPAVPERPASERPAPRPEAAHPPGDRHPACGHPGEPPCRP